MLALFLVLLVVTPPQFGAVHILVEAGDTIYVDGKEAGISSAAASGLLLPQVAVGEHEIFVRTPAGGSTSVHVTVTAGMTSTVSISSLGLRTRARGSDSTIEVQVPAESTKCELAVGSDRVTTAPDELRIEHVRPGPQNVAVTCGEKRAAADLQIPAGKIVTVQADLALGKLHVVAQRDRVTTLAVPTVADKIMRLDLPFTWKRAIAACVPLGVQPRSIEQKEGMRVEAIFSADRDAYYGAESLVMRLKDRPEVLSVYEEWENYTPRNERVFKIHIIFRGGE